MTRVKTSKAIQPRCNFADELFIIKCTRNGILTGDGELVGYLCRSVILF